MISGEGEQCGRSEVIAIYPNHITPLHQISAMADLIQPIFVVSLGIGQFHSPLTHLDPSQTIPKNPQKSQVILKISQLIAP